MRAHSILRRILTMAVVCVLALTLFFLCAVLYYRSRSNAIRETVRAWESAERQLYLCGEAERTEEELNALRDSVSVYYTPELSATVEQGLYDAAAELSGGARTVTEYDRMIKEIRVDYRYGGVRVYFDSVVDYAGYGGYLFSEEEEDISFAGQCTQTIQMEETDDGWRIASIKTEYEKE